jgi:hypothetical protein
MGPLRRLDAHLDLLRWSDIPHFRGKGKFLGDLRRQLARRRRANMLALPVGLLTHHLDHDEAAWCFLGNFIDFAKAHFEIRGYSDLTA